MDGEALGLTAVEIGAGRRWRDEPLAFGAGVEVLARIGDRVEAGDPLGRLLVGEREVDVEALRRRMQAAFTLGEEPVSPPPLLIGTPEAAQDHA